MHCVIKQQHDSAPSRGATGLISKWATDPAKGCEISQCCGSSTYSGALLGHHEVSVLFREKIQHPKRTKERVPTRTYKNHNIDLPKSSVVRQE